MADLERNLHNRGWLVDRLRAEIIGPDPAGDPVDLPAEGDVFLTWGEFRQPKRQPDGEEILWQDPPIKRYGAGILFPAGITESRQAGEEAASTPDDSDDSDSGPDIRLDEEIEKDAEIGSVSPAIDEGDEEDVSLANAWRPAAMGLSFLGDFTLEHRSLSVTVEFATYSSRQVTVGESPDAERLSKRDLWLRRPGGGKDDGHPVVLTLDCARLLQADAPVREWIPGFEGRLELVVISRPHHFDSDTARRFITVCLVNRQRKDAGRLDGLCFFQCGLRIRSESGEPWILPYPEPRAIEHKADDEDEINRLLHRDRHTFAIGHGCAADWGGERSALAREVWTDCLPTFELPSISADLVGEDGHPIRLSMHKLAGFDPGDDGQEDLDRLIDSYRAWIEKLEPLESRHPPIPSELHDTARILIERCRACLARMEAGLAFLRSDSPESDNARAAFRLANHAMLVSQLRVSRQTRDPVIRGEQLTWTEVAETPDPRERHPEKGYWRAFQIAFLLISLEGICRPDHEDRTLVDLIWFPTGGGKTEAYLGLSAFAIFFNRLAGRRTSGCEVLMRYTLRLLTAQQFQRAGLLFCAMEHLRRLPENVGLGREEFRLGMWVGGDATPNRRADARSALRRLQKNPDAENPFVLLKCPWCHARFGVAQEETATRKRGRRSRKTRVLGYEFSRISGSETAVFRCPDPACEFGLDPRSPGKPPLPIVLVDEDLYERPPALVIGTVDKFAMLAWRPEVGRLFGIAPDGTPREPPPSLIIQDELHLISGPLGSMVGAYEAIVEELCTERSSDTPIRPKIVASTATISRAEEQVKALYARDRAMLFPPSGLEAGDSFFARESRGEDGCPAPGRLYAAVMAPGHGSQQTSLARVFAVLLQYPAIMPVNDGDESERDPWWTLVAFFNSLRELGTAATLLVADTRDYLRVILNRHGLSYRAIRQLINWEELTSRVRGDKIPLAIQKLETPFRRSSEGYPRDAVEVCLASNIIEVGVDIDRLSLMTIAGQPKTTSQYIQVSSRVGRSSSAPGLVVVNCSPGKPRDRSHYERFRTFHERLYAQVEPTSVTPFSPPAAERSLHGIVVAAARQLGPERIAHSPRPFPLSEDTVLGRHIRSLVRRRVELADPTERESVMRLLNRRLAEWRAWDPQLYGGFGAPPQNPPLIHPAGSHADPDWHGHSWPTLASLRNVDANCEAEITNYYNELPDEVAS